MNQLAACYILPDYLQTQVLHVYGCDRRVVYNVALSLRSSDQVHWQAVHDKLSPS